MINAVIDRKIDRTVNYVLRLDVPVQMQTVCLEPLVSVIIRDRDILLESVFIMSKKLMTLLLLSVLLLGTACGNGGTPTDTDNQTSSGDQPEESTSSLSYIDKLETKDFGGYEFNICTEGAFDNFYVEEADGDVINDSVFKRNSEVEQRYNIKLNFENIEWKTAPDTIQQNVLAGDKAFDL